MAAKNNFDSGQLERLKVWFDINPSPSRHQVDHISAQMKVASASVWMWFHRQRNRVKANQDISPQKVKTASSKGLSSPIPHMNKVRTRSLSAGLDCNRNTHANRDIQEQVKEREETRQDRVRAKKGHIRGILRRPETRQQSGVRSAEEKVRQTVKEVERKQQGRAKFSEYSEVNNVNEPDMHKLEQERIGLKPTQGSINRTKKEAGRQERIGVDPAQGCFKRKGKVTDSLKQNRGKSLSGYMKRKEKISDPWESNAAKLPQLCIKKIVKEGVSHQHMEGKSVQGSRSRIVKAKDTQKPVRMKSISGSMEKILKEADSRKLIGLKPVLRCLKKTDKVAESQECNRVKSAQGSIIRAEKASEEQQRPLSQSDKECHLKQNKLTHRVKSMSVPERIDSSGNVPANHGVHERMNVSEGKPQIGVNSAPVNRPSEEREGHGKLKKKKDPVAKRRFKEVLGSSEVNVHHRSAEKNLRHLGHRRQLTDMSSSSVHIKKCKHKSRKAKRIQMLLSHKSPNPSVNEVKSRTVLEETEESPEMPQAQSKMQAKICTSRQGIFSALSLPQEKVCANLSDSSDAEDFQDDQNTRTHKLSMKKKNMADTLGNGKSIPVLSRKRQQSTLADCSNRVVGGSNLRRIPLKSWSQVCNNDLPVSPVNCDVSSTSTSQSSVISSTVAEVSDPSTLSLKQCQRSSDSLERDSCGIAIRMTERSLQGKNIEEKESVNEVGKRAGPVISDDKIWNRHDGKFLFKRELSVNLKRINISSVSDKGEVTVSSKMNLTSRHKGKKDSNPLCENDRTDINANVSVNLSSVPKAKGRSIWSSIASSVETSSMVWSSIASSNEKPQQEIPFIESSRTLDRESNKLWSSIASSAEISHKKIPFIESSDSVDGESTPSSSQDSLESKEGLKRSESIFDEDSCEVSSSVDLEKMPAGLSENMEKIGETSSAVVERKKEEVEETSADAIENTVPAELTETVTEMEKTSADVVKRMEEHDKSATDLMGDIGKTEKSSADLVLSKEEVEETPAELMEHPGEAEKTPADLAGNLEGGDKTPAPSTETMVEAKKVTENKKSSGEKERTEADLMETPREVDKAPAELVEKTESSQEKEKEEIDKKTDNKLQDLYEDIDSPDYDIGSPYMVLDEVSCSDKEESEPNVTASQDEFSLESAFSASKSQSPSSPKVEKKAETCEVIEVDNCSDDDDDDEVIVVSSSAAKQTRKDSPGNQPLKNQPLCNGKPVGQGKLAVANKNSSHSPTNPTSSQSTEKEDSHEVIDLEYCSEDDEVILVSTQVPSAPSSKQTAKLSNEESRTGSPTCPQISAQAKSVSQELPIAKENVTTQQYTPSVRDDLSESQGVSGNTEIGTREPVDDNLPSDCIDADVVIANSKNSCSVQNDRNVQVSECPTSKESHEDSAEAALSSEKKVDADKEHFHETTDLCLIKNVVSLCSPLVSAACVMPPQLVQGKEEKLDISSSEKVAAILVKKISDEDVYKEEGNECKEEKIKLLRSLGEIASSLDEHNDHKASRTQDDQQDSCGSASAGPIAVGDLKTEEMDALAQNVGHGDYQSSDDIILDMSCETISTVSYAQDNLKSSEKELDTSKQSVGQIDSSSDDELVIDMEACDQMECSLPEKDVSENTSASLSNAAVVNLDLSEDSVRHDNSTASDQIDLNLTYDACTRPNAEKDLKSSEKVEESESDAGHKASGSSDEHFIDVNDCDEMESALLEKDALEKDTSEKDNCPSSNDDGVVLKNSTSEEIFIDVTTCEETKCSLRDRNVSETDTNISPNDTFEGKLDPVKQTVVCEDSTFDDKLYIDVTTCDDTDSSLQSDAVSENDANAFTCNALGEEMDPSKKNVPCEDSASDDELYIDVTTCDDMDCPSKDIASSENSINTSLDSSLKSKKLALASDANSSGSVADVLNQGSLDKESAGNNSEVLRELELPLHVQDSTLSSNDTLPCETKVHLDGNRSPSADAETTSMELSKGLDAEDATGEARSSAYACTSDCDMDVATPSKSKLNADASLMGTSNKSSPSPAGAPTCTIDSPRISSEALETLSDQKEEPAAGQHADAHGSSSPSKAVNIPVENTPIPSLVSNDVTFTSSSVNASTSSVTAEDPQLEPSALSDAANHRLPETGIKIRSEPDVAAEKDTQAETNTRGVTTKHNNSAEKLKRPRSLSKLVSDLTQRLGISVEAATPSPSSVDLPRSTVGINRNASYSAKSLSSSSSIEPAHQPPKPTQEPRRGSKRRVISNKNFKRPPIPEAVQLRIQQLNPYPCDHSWMRNAAVVELAQKEAQLDCQPGETSSATDHNMGASIESSYLLDATDTAAGTLNFCYQPGMGPINRDSRCATDRVSTSATAASSSVSSRNQRAEAQPSGSLTNSGQCTTIKNNTLLNDLLKSTEPLKRKRSRTQSGDSKKRRKSRKRRKSDDDVRWEIASRANTFANGSFSEKDIREEWKELLKVMEESTLSGTEEQPPSSGTITLTSSATAAASEGNPNYPTVVPAEGHPPTVLRVSEMSSTTSSASASASAEDKLPATRDDQAAALRVSETSSTAASALEVDDLSNMPSILRVFSLREEEGGQESSPILKPSSLGSFDPDSAKIVEAQVYSSAAAAAAASATRRSFQGTTNPASSLPSCQPAQALNRKSHSSQTFGSMDGAPPLKAAATATAVNGPTFQEIPAPVLQENQTNMNTSFPQQVSSVRVNDSGSSSGALPTYNALNSTLGNRPSGISPDNSYVINTPIVSPPSSNAQGATGILASPPVLVAPQPVVTLVPIQPRAQQQVQPSQPSLVGNGTTLVGSHLNPLILNQEIQRLRFNASPPLCTPYPTSSVSANVNLNTLSGQPAPIGNAVGRRIAYLAGNALGRQLATGVNTQWTQPVTNLQLAPVTSQTYSNGLNSQSSTLIYNPQDSTLTFLPGPPR